MSISNFVKKARDSGLEYSVYKNWYQPTPTFKEIRKIQIDTYGGRVSLEGKELTIEMDHFLIECISAYPKIDYDYYTMLSSSYRNLTPDDSGTPSHTDEADTLHWQCRGATEWIIGSSSDSVILEPGDLIWFRANTWHKTSNLTEKCSLMFSEKKK